MSSQAFLISTDSISPSFSSIFLTSSTFLTESFSSKSLTQPFSLIPVSTNFFVYSDVTRSSSSIVPSPSVIIQINYLTVIAGVPLATITIVIVLLIASCATAYNCYIHQKIQKRIQLAATNDNHQYFPKDMTLKNLHNELYQ